MLTNGAMDDEQLVDRVLQGHDEAFVLLIERYKRLVAHMVSRVVANQRDLEEVCQDVFIKVYDSLGSFRGRSKLSTWIATISYRIAINHAKKVQHESDHQDLDAVAFNIGFHDQAFEQKDFTKFIHAIVAQMPETYRTVLTLFYLEGFSYPEIVEITGMPEGTVKNYLHRARAKMKKLLEPYCGTELDFVKEVKNGG